MIKLGPLYQEGRKPNRKSETEPESPKTEPVAVYKETKETGKPKKPKPRFAKSGTFAPT